MNAGPVHPHAGWWVGAVGEVGACFLLAVFGRERFDQLDMASLPFPYEGRRPLPLLLDALGRSRGPHFNSLVRTQQFSPHGLLSCTQVPSAVLLLLLSSGLFKRIFLPSLGGGLRPGQGRASGVPGPHILQPHHGGKADAQAVLPPPDHSKAGDTCEPNTYEAPSV